MSFYGVLSAMSLTLLADVVAGKRRSRLVAVKERLEELSIDFAETLSVYSTGRDNIVKSASVRESPLPSNAGSPNAFGLDERLQKELDPERRRAQERAHQERVFGYMDAKDKAEKKKKRERAEREKEEKKCADRAKRREAQARKRAAEAVKTSEPSQSRQSPVPAMRTRSSSKRQAQVGSAVPTTETSLSRDSSVWNTGVTSSTPGTTLSADDSGPSSVNTPASFPEVDVIGDMTSEANSAPAPPQPRARVRRSTRSVATAKGKGKANASGNAPHLDMAAIIEAGTARKDEEIMKLRQAQAKGKGKESATTIGAAPGYGKRKLDDAKGEGTSKQGNTVGAASARGKRKMDDMEGEGTSKQVKAQDDGKPAAKKQRVASVPQTKGAPSGRGKRKADGVERDANDDEAQAQAPETDEPAAKRRRVAPLPKSRSTRSSSRRK